MDYSIVILNYKNPELTIRCIESIFQYNTRNTYEIIVVNNSKEDDVFLREWLHTYHNVAIISPWCNTYFITGVAIWVKKAQGKYIALVNNDGYFEDNSLEKMLDFLQHNHEYWGVTWKIVDLKTQKVSMTANGKPTFRSEFFVMTICWWIVKKLNYFPSFYKNYLYYWWDRNSDKNVFSGCNAYFMFEKRVFDEIWWYDLNLLLYYSEYDFWFKLNKVALKTKYLGGTSLFHEWWDSTSKEKSWKINAILLHDRYQIFKKRYWFLLSFLLVVLTILFNPYILKNLVKILKVFPKLHQEVENNKKILAKI